jgi:hypothetical protein
MVVSQQLAKNVTEATNTHKTTGELLYLSFVSKEKQVIGSSQIFLL